MDKEYSKPEIFNVKATRCQRCGGILLSEFGLKNGMGHVCKKKADAEGAATAVDENQLTLEELIKGGGANEETD